MARYSVTVFIAAPGTPMNDANGNPKMVDVAIYDDRSEGLRER